MLLVCLSDKLYSFMFAVKAVARTPSPRKLEGNMPEGFPRMVTIQQAFPSGAALDIQANLHAQLAEKLGSRVKPGARIGVAVGSRGITNLLEIVLAAIDWLKERGTRPFIIPAMGSHGGATAEGQVEVLSSYGISERAVGVPIKASLDVQVVGRTDDGVDVYFSSEAFQADGILVINRVKPHTDFSGNIGSGVLKMIAIGLGKRIGAMTCHAAAVWQGHEQVIRKVASVSLRQTPILGAIAILENQSHVTCKLTVVKKEEIFAQEEELFKEAKGLMPRLPFDEIDFLIVDRMGKNISGAGMDPNIIGRSIHGYSSLRSANQSMPTPRVWRIFVRDLTPEAHGNATGVGMADLTTTRLVCATNTDATFVNALTSMTPLSAKIPIHFETDLEAIRSGLASLAIPDTRAARVVRIADTLSLEVLQAAAVYSEFINQHHDLKQLSAPEEMKFDSSGNLLPFQ